MAQRRMRCCIDQQEGGDSFDNTVGRPGTSFLDDGDLSGIRIL
jgi:hypothetical protein